MENLKGKKCVDERVHVLCGGRRRRKG